MTLAKSQQFPVIYQEHIYFPSSSSHRNLFIENPIKYISQLHPGPSVPLTLSIIGPPKSGKTTCQFHCFEHFSFNDIFLPLYIVATRFCSEYGCVRLSLGEVLRRIITNFPNSKLAELIESHLKVGQTVPEDLCIHALESALLDVECCTRGLVNKITALNALGAFKETILPN